MSPPRWRWSWPRLGVLAAVTANAVTKGVLAALSGPRPFVVRIVLGQLLAVGGLWLGWLVSG